MSKGAKTVVAVCIIVMLIGIIAIAIILTVGKTKSTIELMDNQAKSSEKDQISKEPINAEVPINAVEENVAPAEDESESPEGETVLENEELQEEPLTEKKDILYTDFKSLPIDPLMEVLPSEFYWYDETKADNMPPEGAMAFPVVTAYGEYSGVLVSVTDFSEYNFMKISVMPKYAENTSENTAENTVKGEETAEKAPSEAENSALENKATLCFKQKYITTVYSDEPQIADENAISYFDCDYSENLLFFPFLNEKPMNIYFFEDEENVYAKCKFYEYETEKPSYILLLTRKKAQ